MLKSEAWAYSARSDVLSHTVGSVETLYAYDDEGQLLSESRPGYATAYTYDGNGNRKTRTVNSVLEEYAYDSGDKLVSVVSGGNTRTFTYDLAGRMLTDSLDSRSFVWTAGSRLASVSSTSGSEVYTYNPFGTRAKVGSRTFLRAGAGVTAGVLDDGNAVYTPGVSEKRGSVTTFSHSGLKNAWAQTDAPASGGPGVQAAREYDAFGAATASSGSWQGPFGTAGAFGYQTEASGLHLLGHRYYDASLGRFISRDPVGDGSNWYAYCANDPVAFVDFDGLKTMALTGSDLLADGDRIDYRFGDVGDAVDRAIIDGIETGFGGLGNAFSLGVWQPGPDVRGRAGYDFSVGAGNVAVEALTCLVKAGTATVRFYTWSTKSGSRGVKVVSLATNEEVIRVENHGPWKKRLPKWKWWHVHFRDGDYHLPWEAGELMKRKLQVWFGSGGG